MKKLLLSFAIVASSAAVIAQSCSPLQTWADTVDYGAFPDTLVNLPPAQTDVFYTADLNFKVPNEVTQELDPSGSFVGSPIESFIVTGVSGLPAGYDFACNIATCEFLGGANGCANVYGTTATAGVYDISIDVTATVLVTILGFTTPVEQDTQFTGYKIVVGTAGLIEAIIEPLVLAPNPASGKVTLSGVTKGMNASHITINDLTGKEVFRTTAGAENIYTFDVSDMEAGLYFVNVYHGTGVESVKFIKE